MFTEGPLSVLSARVPQELKQAIESLARESGVSVGELLHLLASGKVHVGKGGLYRHKQVAVDANYVESAARAVKEAWR